MDGYPIVGGPRPPGRRVRWLALALGAVVASAATPAARGSVIQQVMQVQAARQMAVRALTTPNDPLAPLAARWLTAFETQRQRFLNSDLFRREEAYYATALQSGIGKGVGRPIGEVYLLTPDATGRLIDSPIIDYLHWRRFHDGVRAFDYYHPEMVTPLNNDLFTRSLPPPTPPVIPTTPTPPVVIGGQPDTHPDAQYPVPEPSSLAVWVAIALGLAYGVRRRRAARA